MIAYFDASALVKHYIHEVGSDLVQQWLAAPRPATSRWSQVEMLSAISRRSREGQITPAERNVLAAGLGEDLSGFLLVELTEEVIAASDGLFARHPLRAGDCVQLASALVLKLRTGQPVSFHAFDQRLNDAAVQEGLLVAGLP